MRNTLIFICASIFILLLVCNISYATQDNKTSKVETTQKKVAKPVDKKVKSKKKKVKKVVEKNTEKKNETKVVENKPINLEEEKETAEVENKTDTSKHFLYIDNKLGNKVEQVDMEGRVIHEGAFGSRYYINKNGKKFYIKKK